jgi:hypothetical protein
LPHPRRRTPPGWPGPWAEKSLDETRLFGWDMAASSAGCVEFLLGDAPPAVPLSVGGGHLRRRRTEPCSARKARLRGRSHSPSRPHAAGERFGDVRVVSPGSEPSPPQSVRTAGGWFLFGEEGVARRGVARVLLSPQRVYGRAAQRRCSACSQSTQERSPRHGADWWRGSSGRDPGTASRVSRADRQLRGRCDARPRTCEDVRCRR